MNYTLFCHVSSSSPAPDGACPRFPSQTRPFRATFRAPLSAVRYVPGLQPHPTRDRAGHSYRGAARAQRHPPWDPGHGVPPADWLIGVDLFNAFYFWEAHEAWEGPWSAQPRDGRPAQMLQGLIQIAAAMVKVRLGSAAGAATLSEEGSPGAACSRSDPYRWASTCAPPRSIFALSVLSPRDRPARRLCRFCCSRPGRTPTTRVITRAFDRASAWPRRASLIVPGRRLYES